MTTSIGPLSKRPKWLKETSTITPEITFDQVFDQTVKDMTPVVEHGFLPHFAEKAGYQIGLDKAPGRLHGERSFHVYRLGEEEGQYLFTINIGYQQGNARIQVIENEGTVGADALSQYLTDNGLVGNEINQ